MQTSTAMSKQAETLSTLRLHQRSQILSDRKKLDVSDADAIPVIQKQIKRQDAMDSYRGPAR